MLLSFILICQDTDAEDVYYKRFGNHDFPKKSPKGIETANEFQILEPEFFRDGRAENSGTYTIDDISPLLISNDEVVTVKYSASSRSTTDWIGAYSPADVDITTTVPVKYGWCDDSSTYISNGYGALTFNLTNLRAEVAFYYFTGGTSKGVLVASYSKNVDFKNYNQPLRERIVPTGDYDIFKLLWSSASSAQPMVRWGTERDQLTQVIEASTASLAKSDYCGAPANTKGYRELGLIHTALLSGMLTLGSSKLYYQVGDAATNDFSDVKVFFMPPLPGQQPLSRPTTAILFDDLGRGSSDMTYVWNEYGRPAQYTIMSVAAEIAAGNVDVVYHGGDISYATGYLVTWDFYLDMIAPMAGSALYLTTVGNHESDWTDSASYFSNTDSGGECGVPATTLIPMPSPATRDQPWWSYNVGLIHFVGMSSEHNFSVGTAQYDFIEKDLASVNRSITPWVIFGCHRAMYLNSYYGGGESSDIGFMNLIQPIIEPLMFKYKVNLAFYGHNHVVQRQAAVLNQQVVQHSTAVMNADGSFTYLHEDPQATVHMVVGTGGATFTKTASTPAPDWNEMFFYQYGYARVTAVNASYLDWKWLLGTTGEVLDHMVLTQKDATKPFEGA